MSECTLNSRSHLARNWGKYVRWGVTTILLAWVAFYTDWDKVGDAFANLRIEWWLTALGLLFILQLTSAWRWQMFARSLGFHRRSGQIVGFYFIGMYFNLLLPTAVGGDVVRAWYLDGGGGRRLAALGTVFLDRLSGLMVLLALACVGLALSPLELPTWIPWFVWGAAVCAVTAIGGSVWLAKRGKHATGLLRRLRLAEQALRTPRVLLGSTVLSLGVQAGNVAIVWLVGKSISAEIPDAYYWIMVPMVSLLTMLPVSINGMGVREGATVLFLAPLGVHESMAKTLAFLWFAVFVAASLSGGLVYLFGNFPKPAAPVAASDESEVEDGPVNCGADQGRTRQHQAVA